MWLRCLLVPFARQRVSAIYQCPNSCTVLLHVYRVICIVCPVPSSVVSSCCVMLCLHRMRLHRMRLVLVVVVIAIVVVMLISKLVVIMLSKSLSSCCPKGRSRRCRHRRRHHCCRLDWWLFVRAAVCPMEPCTYHLLNLRMVLDSS